MTFFEHHTSALLDLLSCSSEGAYLRRSQKAAEDISDIVRGNGLLQDNVLAGHLLYLIVLVRTEKERTANEVDLSLGLALVPYVEGPATLSRQVLFQLSHDSSEFNSWCRFVAGKVAAKVKVDSCAKT